MSPMSSRITLIYTDERGERRRVVVRKSLFTIGSDASNDISIRDPAVSQRHARIDAIAGKYYLSDRRSARGTSLNGQRVLSAVELRNDDAIVLGASQTLSVRIGQEQEDGADAHDARRGRKAGSVSAGEALTTLLRLPAVRGTVAGVLVLAFAALLLFLVWNSGESPNGASNGNVKVEPTKSTPKPKPTPGTPVPTPTGDSGTNTNVNGNNSPGGGGDNSGGGGVLTDELIAGEVGRVMNRIGNDSGAYISDEGLRDIQQRVREYRGSAALAEGLRAMSNGRQEVTSLARSINIKPSLLAYAALAQSGGGDNPVATARQMKPKLLTLCATFTPETANRYLLVVAAYPYPFNPPIGTSTRTTHPLDEQLRKLGGKGSKILSTKAGTVWFLRSEHAIREDAYQLVVRTLAIGVIAQHPSGYGFDADPLPF